MSAQTPTALLKLLQGLSRPLHFCKMNGAGNDFIIIDHREPCIPEAQMADFARLLCRRRFSVGADGLFLLEPAAATDFNADFKWRFFNSDGSRGEMCGNGARCVARFALLHGLAGEHMCFATDAGLIRATVSGQEVSLEMTPPHSLRLNQQLTAAGHSFVVHSVDTGVPHAVIWVEPEELPRLDLPLLGRAIRRHPYFAPAGTNVNFIAQVPQTPQDLQVRTYERGVEAETMACGTGSVAAALIAASMGRAASPVALKTTGGYTLEVHFAGDAAGGFSQVQLKGPAHLVYQGDLATEALIETSKPA